MESTGSYWKPVFNILEDGVKVLVANAFDVRNRRGHKTDPNDSRWLAHLLRHGMIRPSFVPERAIRELRDLTRRRRQLVAECSRERNRESEDPRRCERQARRCSGRRAQSCPGG